jgi:cell division protein FtsN
MKVLSIVFFVIVLMSVGCKTQKIAPKPEPVKSETVKSESAVRADGNGGMASSFKSKEERITAAKGEADDLGSKRFYIILGSFGVYENAQKFKKQLKAEDFSPGILVNEAGLYRVCVNSYNDEETARGKLGEIRQKFPKYSDSWLLIKKQ